MRTALSLLLAGFVALAQTEKPKPESDDTGRPVLKRGGASNQRKTQSSDLPPLVKTPPPDPDAPKPVYERPAESSGKSSDDMIERAREAANAYDETLPDFICSQQTLRSTSNQRVPNWKARDRVEVDLFYIGRKEEYKNIRINGKLQKDDAPEKSGQWSTGDFGSILVDLMGPATNAKFTKRGHDVIAGIDSAVYDYTVEKPNSHWEVRYGPPIRPAYKGAIWVDLQSGRIMRIELKARDLEPEYPLDVVELIVQYGYIKIAGQEYLLPTESENLTCLRGSYECSRNQIQYRNYRKFGAESTITTTDSSVSFEGEAKPTDDKTKKKKK